MKDKQRVEFFGKNLSQMINSYKTWSSWPMGCLLSIFIYYVKFRFSNKRIVSCLSCNEVKNFRHENKDANFNDWFY